MATGPKIAKKAPVVLNKPQAATIAVPKIIKKKRSFFAPEPITIDFIPNEEMEAERHSRLQTMVLYQSMVLLVLSVFLVFLAPIFKPIYHYYARDPAGKETPLYPLTMPNMTNHAVISWAVTGVTEIMTFGFGDIISQLASQRQRFTFDGWQSFVAAFKKQRINETFKENQLVLTTVPSDTAVILAQGQNEEGIYQWKVQVPVIMTYATNNNKSQPHRGVITLTIVRVVPNESPAGIAIKNWAVDR